MWSDPIDNVLAHLQGLLDQREHGHAPTADQWERAKDALVRGRECRAFEQQEGRIVTPRDGF